MTTADRIGYLPQDLLDALSGEGGPQLPRMPQLGVTPCSGLAPMWDDEIDGELPDDRIRRLAAARAICRRCPVRIECDTEAQASPYTEGMWAGFGYYDEFVDLDEALSATNLQPRTTSPAQTTHPPDSQSAGTPGEPMTDHPSGEPTIEPEQLSDLKAMFNAIAQGDDDGAEAMVAAMDKEERERFHTAIHDAFEAELWLYTRAADIVGITLTAPFKAV